MMYTPTYWKILKITKGSQTVYKVLAHWLGDLQYHDNMWRLNSGIKSYHFDPTTNSYVFYGESGSQYKCQAVGECLSGYLVGILEGFRYGALDSAITIEPIDMEDYINEQHSA